MLTENQFSGKTYFLYSCLQVGAGGAARAERRVDEADCGDAGVGEGAAAGAEEEVEEVERVEVQEGGGGEALRVGFAMRVL